MQTNLELKQPKLVIAVRGDDDYAINASLKIPGSKRTPFEVHIVSCKAEAPKGAIAMFTGEENSVRGTYAHAPLFHFEKTPEWAPDCAGVIMLRQHAEIPDTDAFRRALASAARIGWRRIMRRSVYGPRD